MTVRPANDPHGLDQYADLSLLAITKCVDAVESRDTLWTPTHAARPKVKYRSSPIKIGPEISGGRKRHKRGAAVQWMAEQSSYAGDECIFWPFPRFNDGRARVEINGRGMTASRQMLIRVKGEPPTPKHQAAHSCGNGHLGCMTPRHLRWATPQENMDDRKKHGMDSFGQRCSKAVLTEPDVIRIRELLREGRLQRLIAEDFGVSRSAISYINTGATWEWLK